MVVQKSVPLLKLHGERSAIQRLDSSVRADSLSALATGHIAKGFPHWQGPSSSNPALNVSL